MMKEDNVATRLKLFMDYMGLSYSQFADSCGIPRPTLSQLLSGRNKKISDLLVGQIHRTFPHLSILWILFGEGEMLIADKSSTSTDADPIADDSIFAGDFTNVESGVKEIALDSSVVSNNSSDSHVVDSALALSSIVGQKNKIGSNPRKVIQITVYYDDSTFETFLPEIK